jgi:hypothetical protein
MNAKQARDKASGRDYSDYLVDQILKCIAHAVDSGRMDCQYLGGGATAYSPEMAERAKFKLEIQGYKVKVYPTSILVNW